ncbi:hypothetical protein [Pontibacter rugosus]|uniref:SpoIIAA-like protein n=1 Tax=Pontibacter rugosus TaxID=1745966 RepID=A0ABW3SPQ7_9BACT
MATADARLEGVEMLEDTSFYTLDYYASHAMVRLVWKRRPSSLEYRKALTFFLNLLMKLRVERALFDNLQAGLISAEDRDWSTFYIKTLLPKSRLKKLASVVGQEVLQRMLIRGMHAEAKNQYELMFFESEQEAFDWLLGS